MTTLLRKGSLREKIRVYMYEYFTISVFEFNIFIKMPPHWGETARGSNKMKNKNLFGKYILPLSF